MDSQAHNLSTEMEAKSQAENPWNNASLIPSLAFSSSSSRRVIKSKKKIRFSRLFLKQFIRKKTSFKNSWTAVLNSDILKVCYIKAQIPENQPNRSVTSKSKSSPLSYLNFRINDSCVPFMQGILK